MAKKRRENECCCTGKEHLNYVSTFGESATILTEDCSNDEGISEWGWTDTHSLNSLSTVLVSCMNESRAASRRGELCAL